MRGVQSTERDYGQRRIHVRGTQSARAFAAVVAQLPGGIPRRNAQRASAVGDVGPNAPQLWEGELGGPDIHAMGWIRTDSADGREEATEIVRTEMDSIGGVEVRFIQDTMALAHENGIGSEGEHFGFADPISQPPIEGADAPAYPGDGVLEADGTWRPVKPGEFLLGYEDEAGSHGTQSPEPRELRLNGTFMVFRKLYQDVAAFRRYLTAASKALYGSNDASTQELVAAKMMGRWRSGCPWTCRPTRTIALSRPTPCVATTSRMQVTRKACVVRLARICAAPTRARRH